MFDRVMENKKLWVFSWTLRMSLGEIYPKFGPNKCRNKLVKFNYCRPKKWNNF
jgi:hypothetical protein